MTTLTIVVAHPTRRLEYEFPSLHQAEAARDRLRANPRSGLVEWMITDDADTLLGYGMECDTRAHTRPITMIGHTRRDL